jgi:subtilisin family serine protease
MGFLRSLITVVMTVGLSLSPLMAAKIAIIDSGTDIRHPDIEPKLWINADEIADNQRDEDRNGYQDDVYGWNFAESSPSVIDYSYLGTLTDDIKRFFGVQARFIAGTHTEEELDWAREKIKDEAFLKRVGIYGNFMHGTHVAGIALKNVEDAEMMTVKLIPTEVKLPFYVLPHEKGAGMWLMKRALGFIATQQVNQFKEIISYVDSHKMEVANGSFGTGYPQAKMIVEAIATVVHKKITEDEVKEVVLHFMNTLITEGLEPFKSATNTLFVFAAGNDGLNNDEYPIYPTNLQSDNIISVAASFGFNELAVFSNYGEKLVDVAAPGVNIVSSAPGNQHIGVSGTSQAAPFVAGVAAQIKDANPGLTPKQIKEIIMGTVDKKSWLAGKVVSAGTTNTGRAVVAGRLSARMPVGEAIGQSRSEIRDIPILKSFNHLSNKKGFVLPLPSTIAY